MFFLKNFPRLIIFSLVLAVSSVRISQASDIDGEGHPVSVGENEFAEFDEDEFVNEPNKKDSATKAPSNAPQQSEEDVSASQNVPAGDSEFEEVASDEFDDVAPREADEEDASVEVDLFLNFISFFQLQSMAFPISAGYGPVRPTGVRRFRGGTSAEWPGTKPAPSAGAENR
jgi:hypothetical protein